jgi:cytochrome c-type biogenesis protein CcmE
MFTTVEDRSEVGKLRGILVIVSLLFAFILPTLIITELTNQFNYEDTPAQYITSPAQNGQNIRQIPVLMLCLELKH